MNTTLTQPCARSNLGESLDRRLAMLDATSHPFFQLAPVALSVLDCDLRQIAANERFYDVFGYERGADLTSATITFAEDIAAGLACSHLEVEGDGRQWGRSRSTWTSCAGCRRTR